MAELLRSTNPVLKESAFAGAIPTGETMTIQGTVNKTGLLLLFVVATAAWTWGLSHSPTPEAVYPWMMGGAIGGFVVGLVTVFKKEWSPVSAPVYALLEGLLLGGISAIFERSYPGIAVQAISLTFGVMFVLLLAYKFRIVQATRGFKLGVIAATGGIALVYALKYDDDLVRTLADVVSKRRHTARDWDQPVCGDHCVSESDHRFRHDRDRSADGRTEVYGVVWRVRDDGYADLVVS